jgi:hypothetical protein
MDTRISSIISMCLVIFLIGVIIYRDIKRKQEPETPRYRYELIYTYRNLHTGATDTITDTITAPRIEAFFLARPAKGWQPDYDLIAAVGEGGQKMYVNQERPSYNGLDYIAITFNVKKLISTREIPAQ